MQHIINHIDQLASLVKWPDHEKINETKIGNSFDSNHQNEKTCFMHENKTDSLNSNDDESDLTEEYDFSTPEQAMAAF